MLVRTRNRMHPVTTFTKPAAHFPDGNIFIFPSARINLPKWQTRKGERIRSCLSDLLVIFFALNFFDCGGPMSLIELEILVEVSAAHILVEELSGRMMLPVKAVAS